MLSRTAHTVLLFGLAAFLALSGCAPMGKSVVWKDKDASLADYKAFKILPVFDATDKFVEKDILTWLTALLNERFQERHLSVTDSPENEVGVLTVRTELLAYEIYQPAIISTEFWLPPWGTSRCTLRTELTGKSNSYVVARIVATQEAGASLDSLGTPKTDKRILEATANKIVEEIARLMQAEAPR
jgi:hypothetical protein